MTGFCLHHARLISIGQEILSETKDLAYIYGALNVNVHHGPIVQHVIQWASEKRKSMSPKSV